MSSFICGPDTIHKITTYLNREDSGFKKEIQELLKIDLTSWKDEDREKSLVALGQALQDLNARGTGQRYNMTPSEALKDFGHKKYKKHVYKVVSLIKVLKALQCPLYQCSEGDTDEQPLYKLLRKIEYSIMHKIINKIPEYERAMWG